MKRSAQVTLNWTAWIVGCALLAACGGGTQSVAPPGGEQSAAGALVPARSGELLDYVKTMLGKRAQQRLLSPAAPAIGVVLAPASGSSAGAAAPAVAAATYSDTTVQETGVDEDDLLETDGVLLIALARQPASGPSVEVARVQLQQRRADGGLDALASVSLAGESGAVSFAEGMYYASDLKRVAVLGSTQTPYPLDVCGGVTCSVAALFPVAPIYQKPSVWIDRIDVGDPSAPVLEERIRIDGRLIGSRRIGPKLILVTQHSPQLPVDIWPANAPQSERDLQIARLKATDLLPTIAVGNAAPRLLTAETDCFLQPANASLGIEITTITVLDLAGGGTISRCFAGGSEALYMSSTNLYLATTRYAYDFAAPLPRFAPDATTDLHKFALGAGTIDYRGSGEVAGNLGWDLQKRSYRMSEWGDDLRVLTYTASLGWGATPDATAPSPARLSILRESGTARRLDLVARLPNDKRPQPLGKPDEQVYAVRFLGARGYLVTFRRIDPMYVLDLADPADPKVAGELLTAGFSDYLFPIDNGLLLGVGKDATADGRVGGVKVALFDVAGPAQPSELAALTFGGAGSASGLDFSRHGVSFLARNGVVRVGLPLVATAGASSAARRGLQRFEIDPTARMLAALSMVPPLTSANPYDLSDDRSVQVDDFVYYWAEGQVNAVKW